MGLFDNLTKKQLPRKNLVNIIENWDMKKETNINKEAYLAYLNKLEEEINKHSYKNDNRFITYGRREFLRKEFTERLNDAKQTNNINKYIDALVDLEEYIYTQNHLWIGAIPDNVKVDLKKLDKINTEYYNLGLICKEEKNIIIEMINEFKNELYSKELYNINNEDLLKKFIEIYKPDGNQTKPDEEILNFGRKVLPKEIIEIWEKYGFGTYGNGLIKIVDPRDYMDSLYTWLGQKDFNRIPIMVTSFGDIFYYRKLSDTENDISLLDIHYGKISVCSLSYKEFFRTYITNEKVIKDILRQDLHNEAIRQVGELSYKEIFFFVPALILGGAENIKYIKKGDGVTHQFLLFSFRTR